MKKSKTALYRKTKGTLVSPSLPKQEIHKEAHGLIPAEVSNIKQGE